MRNLKRFTWNCWGIADDA